CLFFNEIKDTIMSLLQKLETEHCKILFEEPIGFRTWLVNHGVEDI
ncbi:14560_t:CDS:1, partial [Funneliformis geosporum]